MVASPGDGGIGGVAAAPRGSAAHRKPFAGACRGTDPLIGADRHHGAKGVRVEKSTQERVLAAIARQAVGVSRRDTLMTLGGAGLTTLAGPSIAIAAKSNKKANRRAKKKGKRKCKKQDGQCVQVFEDICAGEADPEFCEDLFIPCCAFLAQCQTTAFFECAFASAAS
jgi:hypothetical protein